MRKKEYHLSLQKGFINEFLFLVHNIIGDNMRILITGGRSGLGFELAKKLSLNNTVYLTVHTSKQYETLKEEIKKENLKVLCFKLDITNKIDLKLINTLEIDTLICNAAIGNSGSILDCDISTVKETYNTNVFSTLELIKTYCKSRNTKRSKIFVISSIAGIIPIPYLGSYTSSKAALSMFVRTLKYELPKNISISLVELGAFHTGFNQSMIDSIEKNSKKKELNNIHKIKRVERNIFSIIEVSTDKIVKKLVKSIEKKNSKFLIRIPFIQSIFSKLYLIFIR